MSDQGYTPTTDEVCSDYIRASAGPFIRPNVRECHVAEFDRWLAEVRREAAEKAWDEGERAGMHNDRLMTDGSDDGFADNPYRKVASNG